MLLYVSAVLSLLSPAHAFLDPRHMPLKGGRNSHMKFLTKDDLLTMGQNQPIKRSKDIPHPCIQEHIVYASDGTRLTTTVIIPDPCDQKYPAVIDRTPYGPTVDLLDLFFVPNNFIAILQNQRGCFTSGGDYDFWKMDGSDAYDTMVWATNQSWYNGEIFISGASADGCSALADYTMPNPYIKGSNIIWATAYGHEASYWGGAYRYDLISHWLLTLDTCPNSNNIEQQVRQNEAYTEWWAPLEANGPYGNNLVNVDAPGVMQAGWWDIFLEPQIKSFDDTLQYCTEDVVDKLWLWIIPGGHCTGDENTFGYPKFESLESFPRMSEEVFKGNFNDQIFNVTERYNVYVFGPVPLYSTKEEILTHVGNYWTSFPSWPVYMPQNWYLGANGVVSTTQNGKASYTYTYDPSNPAKATGANTLYSSTPCGPRDQSALLGRSDVLSWAAPAPFREPVAMVGKITATLTVSSTAVDTDFYVTLTDQYPNGGPLVNVRYGAIKMRWRNDPYTPENMVPGETYTVEVDMWSTAYIWNKGHTLGVIITSSRSPEFTVNPNNGYPLYTQAQGPLIIANNTIICGENDIGLSYITLPIVSMDAIKENPNIR